MKRVDPRTVHATAGSLPGSAGVSESDFAFAHQAEPPWCAAAGCAGAAAAGFAFAFCSMILSPASSSSKTKQPDTHTQSTSNANRCNMPRSHRQIEARLLAPGVQREHVTL